MRLVLRMVALTIVYLGTPGLPEAVEDLSHLATEGHTLHAAGHDTDRGCEHGCSGPVHRCQCCHSMSFLPSSAMPALERARVASRVALAGPRSGPAGHRASIARPPSA